MINIKNFKQFINESVEMNWTPCRGSEVWSSDLCAASSVLGKLSRTAQKYAEEAALMVASACNCFEGIDPMSPSSYANKNWNEDLFLAALKKFSSAPAGALPNSGKTGTMYDCVNQLLGCYVRAMGSNADSDIVAIAKSGNSDILQALANRMMDAWDGPTDEVMRYLEAWKTCPL